ncbi:hypothetical protein CL632_01295 [bacterium]|jgi:dTDP-glucose pyrophosphorylase|nr:hypothetical protein [bacterium]MDP6571668.1 sugar phosphate nucleotidyltransferase [Patescibacteria group bacterium]MDP6756244.1 sugar phosphate nucleotidyltransferase [Patescibacteria group bacterium]|tara:strand:- start:14630 stop:15358 length:729 start_codon:yes stop_codon:yes gene_type:complete
MINKIVIPAAGQGTRMLDLAKDRPKHLIDVLDDKPFLYYVLKNLQNAGFAEMILVVGNHAEKMVEFAQGDGKEFPLTLIDQFKVMGTEKYGTAIPVLAAQEAVGDEQFVCIYGDNLYSTRDLKAIRELDDDYNYVSLLYSETPEKYGVPIIENDKVTGFVEKPKQFISNWVSIGCYKFTPDIFPEAAKVGVSERGEYELTDAIAELAKQGKVKARKMLDYWMDFGNPDDVKKVAEFLESGKA